MYVSSMYHGWKEVEAPNFPPTLPRNRIRPTAPSVAAASVPPPRRSRPPPSGAHFSPLRLKRRFSLYHFVVFLRTSEKREGGREGSKPLFFRRTIAYGLPYMTSAKCSDFLTPFPHVTVTNQLILFLFVCFLGNPCPHPLRTSNMEAPLAQISIS